MDFVYYSDIIHLTPYGMAVTYRTPHNALLRKAAQFSDLRLLFCAFFLARKKGPKKVQIILRWQASPAEPRKSRKAKRYCHLFRAFPAPSAS